jgi:hypothetical protein
LARLIRMVGFGQRLIGVCCEQVLFRGIPSNSDSGTSM